MLHLSCLHGQELQHFNIQKKCDLYYMCVQGDYIHVTSACTCAVYTHQKDNNNHVCHVTVSLRMRSILYRDASFCRKGITIHSIHYDARYMW